MKNALKNPSLHFKNEIKNICSPLEKLDISYFSHVHIDNDRKFSVICNNPEFIDLYYQKEYFNTDLHTADIEKYGPYVIWDALPRTGKTLQMGRDAADLGILHTFTLTEKDKTGFHLFHFSTHIDDKMINQIYLSNLDLLKMFIRHFKSQVKQSRHLSTAHQFKTQINQDAEGYSVQENFSRFTDQVNSVYLELLNSTHNELSKLTQREVDCLQHIVKGKTAKEISDTLGLTRRTVEFYLANIKSKLNVSSKSQLIAKVFDWFV